jgi:hypothetical protein
MPVPWPSNMDMGSEIMSSEQDQKLRDELLKLIEDAANGDISASVAISLKRIADKLAETPATTPPKIMHR